MATPHNTESSRSGGGPDNMNISYYPQEDTATSPLSGGGSPRYPPPMMFDDADSADDEGPTPPLLDTMPLPEPTPNQREAMGDFVSAPSEDRWLQLVEAMEEQKERELLESCASPRPLTTSELPDGTAPIMDEFMKAPSQEGWHQLVEAMKRQKEEEIIEFYKENGMSPARNNDAEDTRDALNIVDSMLPQESKPDPPSPQDEDEEEMLGWTMYGLGHKHQAKEDAEVSNRLKAIVARNGQYAEVGADEDDHSTYPSTCSSSSCSLGKRRRRPYMNSKCVFFVGFVVGMAIVVGISFGFDRSPSQEIQYLRAYGRKEHIGDSRDETNDAKSSADATNVAESSADEANDAKSSEEQDEYAKLRAKFCGTCQWKNMPFTCGKRVEWEMKEYGMKEEVAMAANIDHCTKPADGDNTAGEDPQVAAAENKDAEADAPSAPAEDAPAAKAEAAVEEPQVAILKGQAVAEDPQVAEIEAESTP